MTSGKIRKKFLNYFKKNNHSVVESSSLWPQDDPSVLLTTAGMQQFKPYFLGDKKVKKDFNKNSLTSSQRCFRTSDIELVGDATHSTFFEMLGNFSMGGYFKEEAIKYAWEFLTDELKISGNKMWATYFNGDKNVSEDGETVKIWKKYLPKKRIIGFGRDENWWGPPGKTGPCGPSSEIHFDFTGKPCDKGAECLPNCDCGRFMELWNLVFMQYKIDSSKRIKELPSKNIDTGMGLERLTMLLQKKYNIFDTDLYQSVTKDIMKDKNFGSTTANEDIRRSRIVADHIKGSVFLIADGISFSNKEQGYILRRVFRRALDQYLYPKFNLIDIVDRIIAIYREQYPFLVAKKDDVLAKMDREIKTYDKILKTDIAEISKKIISSRSPARKLYVNEYSARKLTAQEAFKLYSTYGLSSQRLRRKGYEFDEAEFKKEIIKHQKLSKSSAVKKFGGHGLNSSELPEDDRKIMTRLHTATHLLQQALRDVLGDHVRQQGSDITPARLRFDFEHPAKLTDDQKKKVEEIVNGKIELDLKITSTEMSYQEAIDTGALAFFGEKYGDKVTVYSVGDYSKELCGGPHVNKSGSIGKFSIISEKSSSAGIRRIKAIVE
ncbi:alanine--tRNA ligase [Patescibacteria group bacterium]|nr:alanine--tRNA ligase [Patescibacteria group bacterium]